MNEVPVKQVKTACDDFANEFNEFKEANIELEQHKLEEAEDLKQVSDINKAEETVQKEKEKIDDRIRNWFLNSPNQSFADLSRLLEFLQEFHPELPKSDKGLLPIPKHINKRFAIVNFDSESKFSYFGIEWQLKRMVDPVLHKDKIVYLKLNIDGLPLYKSSDIQFWPILGQVYYRPSIYAPFTIALYCGKGKPSNIEQFFSDLINEINYLKENTIEIDGQKIEVRILCFICDNPARSFIKCVKGHTAYYGCERCIAKSVNFMSRRIYPTTVYEKRSNDSFLNKLQPEHHIKTSPLVQIKSIDMIYDFTLDSLHLLFLGVMKRFLSDYWTAPGNPTKLSSPELKKLTERLTHLSNKIPVEFQRTTRSLHELSKWKATEYRMFLLYYGPFVLDGLLNPELLLHFLLFHVACRIVSSDRFIKKFLNLADLCFHRFVLLSKHFYGFESLCMTMHNLSHICDDVRYLGLPVSEISAFDFENALHKIKLELNSGFKPMEQFCKKMKLKLIHKKNCKVKLPPKGPIIIKKKKNENFDTEIITEIEYKQTKISIHSPNNIVLLKNLIVLEVEEILCENSTDFSVNGKILDKKGPSFTYPINSQALNIYEIENNNLKNIKLKCKLSDIDCKAFLISIKDSLMAKPKLHLVPFLHVEKD